MAETKSLHMQDRTGPSPSWGERLDYYLQDWPECSGNHGCSSPGSQPMGAKNIDTVNHPWDGSREPCISGCNNLCNCSCVLRGSWESARLQWCKVICGIGCGRGRRLEDELIKVELIMREMQEQRMEPSFKYSPHFEVLHVDGFLGNRWTEGRKKGAPKKEKKTFQRNLQRDSMM